MNKYKLKKKVTKEFLLGNNFKYLKSYSDEDDECYVDRFTVYRYNANIILDCEIKIFIPSNDIKIDVYDYNSRSLYAPFYYNEYGNYDRMLNIINENIKKELKKYNLIVTKNGDIVDEYDYNK